MADILKFTETQIIDESLEEYEYHEYEPITGTSLNNIFGFCEDYVKIVYGLKHSLTLVRKTDDDAIFRAAAAAAGKFSLDKISWFMPHVIPADAEQFSMIP